MAADYTPEIEAALEPFVYELVGENGFNYVHRGIDQSLTRVLQRHITVQFPQSMVLV